jgi:hypothetical protein
VADHRDEEGQVRTVDSIGYHPLDLPRLTLDTVGFWFAPDEAARAAVARAGTTRSRD